MGWSGGSRLFGELIETVLANVPDDTLREEIYRHMIDAFTDEDWDTLDECLGVDAVYDDIYREMYPEAEEDDDERDED